MLGNIRRAQQWEDSWGLDDGQEIRENMSEEGGEVK